MAKYVLDFSASTPVQRIASVIFLALPSCKKIVCPFATSVKPVPGAFQAYISNVLKRRNAKYLKEASEGIAINKWDE